MRLLLTSSSCCSTSVCMGPRRVPAARSESFSNGSAQGSTVPVLLNDQGREHDDKPAVGPDPFVHARRDDAAVGAASLPAPHFPQSYPSRRRKARTPRGLLSAHRPCVEGVSPAEDRRQQIGLELIRSLRSALCLTAWFLSGGVSSFREVRSTTRPAKAGWLGDAARASRGSPSVGRPVADPFTKISTIVIWS